MGTGLVGFIGEDAERLEHQGLGETVETRASASARSGERQKPGMTPPNVRLKASVRLGWEGLGNQTGLSWHSQLSHRVTVSLCPKGRSSRAVMRMGCSGPRPGA